MQINENTLEQAIIVDLEGKGYEYLYGPDIERDYHDVILKTYYEMAIAKINKGITASIIEESYKTIMNLGLLKLEELNASFHKYLIEGIPVPYRDNSENKTYTVKLVDFDNPEENDFKVVNQYTIIDYKQKRPDILVFINGIPMILFELKNAANEDTTITNAYNQIQNYMLDIPKLFWYNAFNVISDGLNTKVGTITSDFTRYMAWKSENGERPDEGSIDFYTTMLNGMFPKERLLDIIRNFIVYQSINGKTVKILAGYHQYFAVKKAVERTYKAIEEKSNKVGVVWHTQGSGKTALAYNLTKVLSDYFSKNNKVAKFYFIVDRLDLLSQASEEFAARGLIVKTAKNREELMEQFKNNQAQDGNTGKAEITVVNIQRFDESEENINMSAYATELQRVFIIDEAHRGYKKEGSFLANLLEADKKAIKIALTGTPLLKDERESWRIFGNYIHTYYYDKSILDGYTLKIIREDIETQYREKITEIYGKLETLVEKKKVKKDQIIEHSSYVKELLRYIITDLNKFRRIQGDDTLGGMIVCETSEQARKIYDYFEEIQLELNRTTTNKSYLKAGLILSDSFDKETRKNIVNDFKKNMTIDILIVYNMLLTGFDAPRLKRLYLGRKLKDHNLLQAITRVNRPYKENRYGYVVDFADIKKNFEETNELYLKELNRFNDPNEVGEGNELDTFNQVIENPTELIQQMKEAQQVLFKYTTDNAEEFSREISVIEDKYELLELKKVLINVRDCCNLVRTFGDAELKATFSKMELTRLPSLISEVKHHIDNINQKEIFNMMDVTKVLVNEAMEEITFSFNKISEEEMKIVGGKDSVVEKYKKTVRAFTHNIDQEDPEFITLQEAFLLRFKEHGFELNSVYEIEEQGKELDRILEKLNELKKKNKVLLGKYNGDVKFVRIHKRIREENNSRNIVNKEPIVSEYDTSIMQLLLLIKGDIDKKVYDKSDVLKKDAYFEQLVMTQIKSEMDKMGITCNRDDRLFIRNQITKQYFEQYNQIYSLT